MCDRMRVMSMVSDRGVDDMHAVPPAHLFRADQDDRSRVVRVGCVGVRARSGLTRCGRWSKIAHERTAFVSAKVSSHGPSRIRHLLGPLSFRAPSSRAIETCGTAGITYTSGGS